MSVLAAMASGCVVAAFLWALLDPPRPIRDRVRPYLSRAAGASLRSVGTRVGRRTLVRVMTEAAAERVGAAIDGLSRAGLERRLRQADLFQDADDPAGAYRLRQLIDLGAAVGATIVLGMALGMEPGQVAGLATLGTTVGVTRQRGRVARSIDERRRRMVIEVYTLDQVLALRIRAGGGVVQTVAAVVENGGGEVVGELSEALRLHRAGLSVSAAFARIAELTPEPACARTYSLLALAGDRGTDLGGALLALADDVRAARREAIRRAATRRRAAMLVPTVAVLAPVMLLFIGAPLPSLILGFT